MLYISKPQHIVIVIPGGTNPEIEILLNNLSHEINYFDECNLWMNTNDKNDLEYMNKLCKKFNFVKCIPKRFQGGVIEGIKFFNDTCVEDKIYIRLDNDICFIEKGAIKKLVNYRIKNKRLFLIFGNVVNNSFTFHKYQSTGAFHHNEHLSLNYKNLGRTGYASCDIMLKMHKQFINDIENKKIRKYYFNNYEYNSDQLQIPVNVISWYGKDLGRFGRSFGNEEEFLNSRPGRNGVCGHALFAHLAYADQRMECWNQGKNHHYLHLRDKYKLLSKQVQFDHFFF